MIKELIFFNFIEVANVKGITVFVGHNNSGKTLSSKEIVEYFISKGGNKRKILKDIKFEEEVAKNIEMLAQSLSDIVEINNEKYIYYENNEYNITHIEKYALMFGVTHPDVLRFLTCFCLYLDYSNSLSVIAPISTEGLTIKPRTTLSKILRNDEKREEIRKIIYDLFGFYICLSLEDPQITKVKISYEKPDIIHERSFTNEAIRFSNNAKPLEEYSDGTKAIIGLVCSLYCDEKRVLVIDEPERGLDTAKIGLLGNILATVGQERNCNIIINTHSSELLMGLLQSKVPINIIRLTYDDKRNHSTVNLLSHESLRNMMTRSFLRSSGFLDALFYKGVVVCEADSDRAFYQEANYHLLTINKGINSCKIINSPNGKDIICHIISALNEVGIPSIAVVDLDILKRGLPSLLDAFNVKANIRSEIDRTANEIRNIFNQLNLDYKNNGIYQLPIKEQAIAQNFLNKLADLGIFALPCGDLEYWFPEFKISKSNKREWLTHIFVRLSATPLTSNTFNLGKDDIWNFLYKIKLWFDKKGNAV